MLQMPKNELFSLLYLRTALYLCSSTITQQALVYVFTCIPIIFSVLTTARDVVSVLRLGVQLGMHDNIGTSSVSMDSKVTIHNDCSALVLQDLSALFTGPERTAVFSLRTDAA